MIKGIPEILDEAMFNFFLEADSETISEIIQADFSKTEDYDRKKRQIIFLTKARINKKNNDYILQLATKIQTAFLENIDKPIAIFRKMALENNSFALYNNFDKLTKENIIEIIKDKNHVELLEALEINFHE